MCIIVIQPLKMNGPRDVNISIDLERRLGYEFEMKRAD